MSGTMSFSDTQDDDLQQFALLRGAPPKVARSVVGNAGSDEVAELLRQRHPEIVDFVGDAAAALLILRPRSHS
jgi:predicted nuclease of predicted toxin-antitoxin system